MQYERIAIRNWRELETPAEGIAVIFDVLRCSTTIQSLLSSKPRDHILVSKSLDQLKTISNDFVIFSELTTEVSCAKRFDNSPAAALEFSTPDTCLVATTSGTPAIFAARNFEKVYVGSLANFSALVSHLAKYEGKISLLPAAKPESPHIEDGVVAEQLAIALDGYSDDATFVNACAQQALAKIESSGRIADIQNADDVQICLDIDRYDFVPQVDFQPWCNIPGLAKVFVGQNEN